ncbi:MAG: PBSX family phage terminase large subunit [Candidatus Omnitrophica bacterium]|nr:PBSX family phage terminase large subunit [Candidatus Omnitrophota bacterium]
MTGARVEIDLRNLRTVTNEAFYPLFWNDSRYLVLVGGAGSGKSVFCAQKFLIRLVTEPGHCLCILRKVHKTIRHSCFALLRQLIGQWGWSKYFATNRSDLTLTFAPTGASIISLGLDDAEKLKSLAGVTSFWAEEATEFSQEDFEQVDLRLRGETPSYKQILLSLNPISRMHWLRKRFFLERQHGMTTTHRSTWRDNRFLDREYIRKIEVLREQNPGLHTIYGEGEWGVLEGLVYQPPLVDAYPATFDDEFYGLDFGFNNPTALVWVGTKDLNRREHRGDVYLRELIYESGLTTPELATRMKALGVPRKVPIYGDPAEPDRIKELGLQGFNCKPADKGEGSVRAGISLCQGLRLHSNPENVNLNKEFETYSWEKSKDGQYMDRPVKFADHAMDAMRYGIYTHLGSPQPAFFDRTKLGI